ncbi:MAG: ROK family transcriptional regulator [Spirochaetota bacterium]
MNYIEVAQGVNPKFQNKINQSVVFNYLKAKGPAHKSSIAEELGLSIPAISRAVDSLAAAGYLKALDNQKSKAGRSVSFYQVSVSQGFVIGIDLLKHSLAVESLGADKSLWNHRFVQDDSPLPVLLAREIEKAISLLPEGMGKRNLKAIGIGSPGIVDEKTGEIKTALFHKEYEGLNLRKPLEKTFKRPVYIDNVVNLSAFAEFQSRKDQNLGNLLCLDIGFEIGAGLVIEGKLYRGANSAAGEIGFLTDIPDKNAPIEQRYARTHSFVWLCAQAKERLGWDSDYLDYKKKDQNLEIPKRLFEEAQNGNKEAKAIVDAYLNRLSALINNVQSVLDADTIVMGGDLCDMPGIKNRLPKVQAYKALELQYSQYGNQTALRGACRWAAETYLANEFPYVMH